MSLLTRLLSPCLWNHAHPLMARNAALQPVWQCSRCLTDLGPVLGSVVLDGPQKAQQPVMGQPTGTAQRVNKSNVSPWKVSSK